MVPLEVEDLVPRGGSSDLVFCLKMGGHQQGDMEDSHCEGAGGPFPAQDQNIGRSKLEPGFHHR